MQALTVAATAVSAIGTLASAGQAADAAKAEGKANQALANYQAKQLEYRAGQERATSQKAAEVERRKARLAVSRGRAVAAASGGGATDPTVMDILSSLRGEGEYNAQSALYEGEESARGLEAQAAGARASGQYASAAANYQAKNIKRAGYMQTAGTLLEGSATFYDRFWPQEDETTYGELSGGPARTRRNWG